MRPVSWRRGVGFFASVVVCASTACTKDVVLPSPSNGDVCGDGIVGPTEDCDVSSPGCTQCKVTPGWQCVQNACFYPCGDGIDGTGPDCTGAHKTLACDLNGWWVARENDYVRDSILNEVQTASTWWLYRLSQSGTDFQVEQALHCGVMVTGSATVVLTAGSLKGLLYANDPSPGGKHGPRKGTFVETADGCTFGFDRFYRVRGGDETLLLPADFSTKPDLATLPTLPYEDDPLHPTGQHLTGAVDSDGDGLAGAAFDIEGATGGIRNSVQRDFKEYASLPGQPVPKNAIDVVSSGHWDLQENVLSVTQCTACALLTTAGHTDPALLPRLTMHFLGTSLQSPRVAAVVVRNPGEDVSADLQSCANARDALPHDPSHP